MYLTKTNSKNDKKVVKRSHWHCFLCSANFERPNLVLYHIRTAHSRTDVGNDDKKKRHPIIKKASSSDTLQCEFCKKSYPNRPALLRHQREQHEQKRGESGVNPTKFLYGACVDIKRGLFLVRRNFTGVQAHVHCQHSTGASHDSVTTSCEVTDCMAAAKVALHSGHPAFECIHLMSLQYSSPYDEPEPLQVNKLDELCGEKLRWLRQSRRKECLKLRAEEGGYPLVVPFQRESPASSSRFLYLSVWDGAVHYWSRFGRTVVTYDTRLNTWSCRCCRSGIGCLRKYIGKWYVYQSTPNLLKNDDKTEEVEGVGGCGDDDVGDDDSEDNTKDSEFSDNDGSDDEDAKPHYSPTSADLERLLDYIQVHKLIPQPLHADLLIDEDGRLPRSFSPSEDCALPAALRSWKL